jgi:hypothetical protein
VKVTILPEPELEFAGGRHIDPRWGLRNYGPADLDTASAPKQVRVGIVGIEHDVSGLRTWLERCSNAVDAASARAARMANFYPSFPGYRSEVAFDSELSFDERASRTLRVNDIEQLQSLSPPEAARQAVALYLEQIEHIAEEGWAQVIVCCRPDLPEPAAGQSRTRGEVNFRDLLKAEAMRSNRPLQVIRRTTWGDKGHPIKVSEVGLTRDAGRTTQDEATRAWNLHTALYYKAGGVPWRMPRRSSDLTTCFVGVGFYWDQNQGLQTSVAQVFNQRGDGVVVRGGPAAPHRDDKQPHLSGEDSDKLLSEAIRKYRSEHQTMPARMVLHKTSSFSPDEVDGFKAAASRSFIDCLDLIWVTSSDETRLFRTGTNNPPLRGTLLETASDRGVLYTRGTVPFYGAYPGMYIPAPIGLRIASSERSLQSLAEETLALTKMNWNDTRLDGREPITLRSSKQVGQVLRFTAPEQDLPGRYAYFM